MVEEIVSFRDVIEHISHLLFFGALLICVRNYRFAHGAAKIIIIG
jgi:hypothetical protein